MIMRIGSIFMLLGAALLAVMAGLLAQTWLEQQRKNSGPVVVEKEVNTTKVVVATQPLRFGTELNKANLKEISWPAGAVPAGAFQSIGDLVNAKNRRVVLAAIEPNEPILRWKITGPGQRASLSAVIAPGHKAVTIRVNDVNGIGGFVLPGDRVDVLLTRIEQDPNDKQKKRRFNDVILQYVRVLGIDQSADDRAEKPVVVKAVTLEVKTSDAQRVTLAANIGMLSLALRPAGATETATTERVTPEDLGGSFQLLSAPADQPKPELIRRTGVIGVTRSVSRSEYSVPLEFGFTDSVIRPLN